MKTKILPSLWDALIYMKVIMAIAANESFQIHSFDMIYAYLQGQPLEREIYVDLK